MQEKHTPFLENSENGPMGPLTAPLYSGASQEWLNARPSAPDRVDLFTLNDDDFAVKCVRELLENRPFELPIATRHPASEWFNHFYFEARNREKVFGTKNLGIGYPFFFHADSKEVIAAPLFVWQLQLEPHTQHVDYWIAQKHDSHNVAPNYPLYHRIDRQFGTDFYQQAQKLVEDQKLTGAALAAFCENLRQRTGATEDGLPLSVQPFNDFIGSNEPRISWSAVAGIYPTLPRTVVTETPQVSSIASTEVEWRHNFSILGLDPSQRSVLHAVHQNSLTVVEGASGTGKTYLISALAINALSNGKKCLVVSKSINALRRAQKFLLSGGFGDVSFIVRDLKADMLMLSDMLRMASDNKTKIAYDEERFNTVLNRTQREQRKLDDAWEELHAPMFGDNSFTDCVGRFLRSNRIQGKELLVSQLLPADFDFSKEEYDRIVRAIYTSEPLFRRFPTLNHPLSRLNGSIFTENDVVKGREWAENKVKILMDKATGLHHRYISKTNDYSEALFDHYEQHFLELSNLVKRISDGLEDGIQLFGTDFEKSISTTEKIYGVFSERYKSITAAKEKIGSTFEELRQAFSRRKYFEFDFPTYFDTRLIKKIGELVKDFEASLRLWRKRIPAVVREDVRRLNAKSIHGDLDYREQIKELEYAMDVFLEEFNQTGLLQEELRHEMLTIPKRQEFLEDVIGRLEEIQFYLRDFDDFYIWQKHWLSLKPADQKVVQALCKIKPSNWQAAFESWYLYHLLQTEFNPGLQWNPETLDRYEDSKRELRQLLPAQISRHWQKRKFEALRTLKNENSQAYKTWFGKNNRSLSAEKKPEELFQNHMETLTETLPVLLVTPEVALDVVQVSNMQFDLVLVDEAHNIPKQECYHLFSLAKHLVVFGDPRQDMTPFAQDDFFEFCQTLGVATYSLDYQHQDSPSEWIEFNKTAFGTPFKYIPAGRSAREATVVAHIGGRFDERTKTNEAEARQIIDWLNYIEPTPAKTYPVVGIACSTVQQRDLIAGQLLKIRQRKAPGFEKIQQLHLNGLGVYQFAELQGQHVDVLLVSLAHGMTDAQGNLTRDLQFWNTQLGFNELNVLLTRATQKLFLAHSLPEKMHVSVTNGNNTAGTSILSHLVRYATFLQESDEAGAQSELQSMRELFNFKEFYYSSSLFMDEVEIALRPYFDTSQIRRNTLAAGMRVPVMIQGQGSQDSNCVLLFDGVLTPSAVPSYEWEAKLRNFFQRNKIDYVPTLSIYWWKSPRQEARRLASRLLRREGHENGGS